MLLELKIKDFILIDDLTLVFGPGLNVLSGETGAGKSIILDAMSLLLGARSRGELVRTSAERAFIEAVFDPENHPKVSAFLADNGWEEEDYIILTREIQANGKSTARLNGRTVSIAQLKSFSSLLIDLHGQEEEQSFIAVKNYLGYVDSYLEDITLKAEVNARYQTWMQKEKELSQLSMDEQERLQRLDFLHYQIQEIEEIAPKIGEEEELRLLINRIGESKRLLDGTNNIQSYLQDGVKEGNAAVVLVYQALEIAKKLSGDVFFAGLIEPLEFVYYSIQDIEHELAQFKHQLDFEPGILEQSEERLHELKKLQKKYGTTTEEILGYLDKIQTEQKQWEDISLVRQALSGEVTESEQAYRRAAEALSKMRQEVKDQLEKAVYQELKDLNLPNMRFAVKVLPAKPSAEGIDQIEFMFSANPGEELRSLIRIASGGERSRFILALKKALITRYQIASMVFDEIDSGLGGVSLNSMAVKLKEIACYHQVLLVTHAPQIAGRADHHFFIEKNVVDGKTITQVRKLPEEERVLELARMLDGDIITEVSLQHAKAMRVE